MKREKLLTGTAALAAAAALSGLFFVCKSNDYMEGKDGMVSAAEERVGAGITAEETDVQSAFRMKEGASIRLNKENDTYGIRFGAVVADETKSYTMMIVPTELAGGYKVSSGITLSEYCEKRAEEAGGRVAKAENLAPDENGEITCALVRVKWENLNRAFTAIAYYEAGGQRIEAARAEENARSVFEVAQKALDSGTLDEAERAAVEQLKADGEKEADGVAVDIGLTESLFEVEKQDEQDHVENEGNDWKFYGKQQLRVKMNAAVWKSRLRYKSGTAEFSLKVANGKGRAKLIDASGEAVLSVGLNYDVEKKVQLSTELLKTCTEIVFERTTETGAESAGADNVDGTGDTGSDSAAQAIYKMSEIREKTAAEQMEYLKKAAYTISHARPTTQKRMGLLCEICLKEAERALAAGENVAEAIKNKTIELNNVRYNRMAKIGSYLVDMFPDNGTVMTHCFAETIVGTMLRECRNRGKHIRLFCPETRPYFQGARLTASVCHDMGFDVTVISDNMPAFVMQNEKVDVFTTAADAICCDGHVVNKVGTFQNAIVAKYMGIPYFVTGAPDQGHPTVDTVHIEMRDPSFTLQAMGVRTAAEGVKGYYPAFDITPPHLVSGVVTDLGIYSPYDLHRYFTDGHIDEHNLVV